MKFESFSVVDTFLALAINHCSLKLFAKFFMKNSGFFRSFSKLRSYKNIFHGDSTEIVAHIFVPDLLFADKKTIVLKFLVLRYNEQNI